MDLYLGCKQFSSLVPRPWNAIVMQGGMRGARTKASVVEQRLGGRLRVDG
jgi:hypothetical protein